MAHLLLAVDRVVISAPCPLTSHVALRDQVGDDPLRRPLRDPDAFGDVLSRISGSLEMQSRTCV
jgi:hypothetical protein